MPPPSHLELQGPRPARKSRGITGAGSRAAWWLAFLFVSPLIAEPPPHHYEVKAALLHSFTKFIAWPPQAFASPDAPFVIGLLGKDPFGTRIDAVLEAKTAQGRRIEIRRLTLEQEAAECHILFLGPMDRTLEFAILKRFRTSPILTLGESDDFWLHNGAIQFIRYKNRVHFRIDLDATDLAGLKIDPNLLKVAREVKRTASPSLE